MPFMKYRLFVLIAVILLFVLLAACGSRFDELTVPTVDTTASEGVSDAASNTAGGTSQVLEPTEEVSGTPIDIEAETEPSGVQTIQNHEFSITIRGTKLILRENELEEKLIKLPLVLKSDTIQELGEGSDTFEGSYIRTLQYNGLELSLFAPKDNKDNFWIMQMTTDDPTAVTYRGVKVGDSAESIKEKYPDAYVSNQDDITTYTYKGIDEYTGDELAFTVSNSCVTEIALTFYLP